ncbi:MAG: lytic transglycosylase domain-containing protein [Burkholderiales bacterium]
MHPRFILVSAALAVSPLAGWAQIYVGGDPSGGGSIVLSNFKTNQTSVLLVEDAAAMATASPLKASQAVGARSGTSALPSIEMQRLVASVAKRIDLSPELLHAVITAESRYDANAVSHKGAIGLMQLLPSTGKRFGAKDLYSAEQNVLAGASYLKWLMGLFGEDMELVLAAYNAGEQAVIRAGRKVPPYPETQAYVRSVMASLRRSGVAAL